MLGYNGSLYKTKREVRAPWCTAQNDYRHETTGTVIDRSAQDMAARAKAPTELHWRPLGPRSSLLGRALKPHTRMNARIFQSSQRAAAVQVELHGVGRNTRDAPTIQL